MNRMRAIMMAGMNCVLCLSATQWEKPTIVGASECLTLEASEHATNQVNEVAKEFHKRRYEEIFAGSPFGSPESSILYVLNVAAKQLQEGDTVYALDLVSFALDILDDGVRYGWYSASDIEPLKRIIMTVTNARMREAGASQLDESPNLA